MYLVYCILYIKCFDYNIKELEKMKMMLLLFHKIETSILVSFNMLLTLLKLIAKD